MIDCRLPTGTVRVACGRASGAVAAPGSKSVTNRLLVMAALADGESLLRHALDSDDSRAMRGLVTALGATVEDRPEGWRVCGTGGTPRAPAGPVDVLQSGTTMRFGMALAALADGPVALTGHPSLLRRPVGPLGDALTALGARVEDHDGRPPVRLSGGGLRGGHVTVDVSGSSQYASALLLVAPYAEAPVRIEATGEAALSYVELTADAMRAWGADVSREGAVWSVRNEAHYRARDVVVEYDASAAAHLFTVAAATGGSVTVTNVDPDTLQADAAFPRLLTAFGCGVQVEGDGRLVTVSGPASLTAPGEWDLGDMPDQLPNAAVLAALADGTTVLRNVAVVRGHETDRIAALAQELRHLHVHVEELPDGLVVRGGVRPPETDVTLHTHDDHRLAMAFAALAARVPGLLVADPACVRKTYPAFWGDLARLGVAWEEVA